MYDVVAVTCCSTCAAALHVLMVEYIEVSHRAVSVWQNSVCFGSEGEKVNMQTMPCCERSGGMSLHRSIEILKSRSFQINYVGFSS